MVYPLVLNTKRHLSGRSHLAEQYYHPDAVERRVHISGVYNIREIILHVIKQCVKIGPSGLLERHIRRVISTGRLLIAPV